MRKILHLLYYWFPPLIWMGCVFFMSSQKSIKITQNITTDFVTFKTLHIIEYAFLFFLLYRAFQSIKNLHGTICGLTAFCITIGYSITDELHQLSIPTRQGRLRDVFIDIIGMFIMYAIIKKVRLIKKLL